MRWPRAPPRVDTAPGRQHGTAQALSMRRCRPSACPWRQALSMRRCRPSACPRHALGAMP
eukprot:366000-Chlamydomonas_euryale.AAC.56